MKQNYRRDEDLTNHLTYSELFNSEELIKTIGTYLDIPSEYKIITEMHTSFEKMLESLQVLTQTKQQRLISLILILFTIAQFLLATYLGSNFR